MSSEVMLADRVVNEVVEKKAHQMDLQDHLLSTKPEDASRAIDDVSGNHVLISPQEQEVPPTKISASDHHTTGSDTSVDSFSRPIGLKRSAVLCDDDSTQKRKRLYQESSKQPDKINVQMIQQLDPKLTTQEANAVLHDYNCALRILKLTATTSNRDLSPTPSLEYMIKLINEWKPKRDIICMYVRWSKRLRRNYHLDSISTLLCVATQCDYTPHIFLKNIKTLTICASATIYGLNFKFVTCQNKAIDGDRLSERFLGLSVTLRLLQRGIVSSDGTFGSIGLKRTPVQQIKHSKNQINMTISQNDNRTYKVANEPASRFHTNSGLIERIWLAIQHRWIAIQVVEMLFPAQLAVSRTEQELLAFSFQMHSSAGPSRYDFLDPLIGVCLRFRSTTIIDNNDQILASVWEKPESFVAFGNCYLQGTTEADRILYITDTFKFLQSLMDNKRKITLHLKTKRETRWQMIRGYAFHFWLERVGNHKMKERVHQLCTSPDQPRKQPSKIKTTSATVTIQPANSLPVTLSKSKMSISTHEKINRSNGVPISGLTQLLMTRRGKEDTSQTQPSSLSPNQESHPQEETAMEDCLHYSSMIDHASLLWTSARLATRSEVSSRVTSQLLIHQDDGGFDIIADLSSLEVYSANYLHKLRHSRRTGPVGCYPKTSVGKPVLLIQSDFDKYVDRSSKIYHVAREDSNFFKEHEHLVPSIQQIANVCKAVMRYGKADETRCPQQLRVNIGCGGQHRPQGIPETLIGMSFGKNLESDNELSAEDIKSAIGMMTEFTWNVMNDMQVEANDCRLAPDRERNQAYASHLSRYLMMDCHVSFEDVTVVVGVLYPSMPNIAEHIDQMNDSVAGYTRTGVFNLVLALEQNTTKHVLVHLQVICNFRRVIREHFLPFHSLLHDVTLNCTTYLAKWQHDMNEIYGGKTTVVPSPFDRSAFFLDDCLPFRTIKISNGTNNGPAIIGEYLLTEISPSRTLSFSLFIDPIVDLTEILCYDQRIELCFVASILSNPFWFEHIVTKLTQKHLNPKNAFCYGVHPLQDWAKETVSVFGAWQGGPHNRWSPFGGDTPFPTLFGAQPNATEREKEDGATKLKSVIQVLYHHIQWVDSLSKVESNLEQQDVSFALIEEHMTHISETIFNIVPCQFSVFRLFVFTTIAVGAGLVKPGVHLKAMMYPVKGSASFKHLSNPNPDQITRTEALSLCSPRQGGLSNICGNKNQGVQSHGHDRLMLYLSYEMGQTTYLRDETECVLCEAHPNRNLQCRDWFKKGRRIYDLNREGCVLQREYGKDSKWMELQRVSTMKFAYLKEIIVYQENDDILHENAMVFGELLQKNKSRIKFYGRNTRTSDCIQQYDNEYTTDQSKQFCRIRHRAANFYNGEYTRHTNLTTMRVLGDGEMPVTVESECNDITDYPDGNRLWKRVLNMVYGDTNNHSMHSARYHQQEEWNHITKTVVFPGHLDKAFVVNAIFVPLSTRIFFTLIAVPVSWYVKANVSSDKRFQEWMDRIPNEEKHLVTDYMEKFKTTAELYMKVKVDVRVYLCSAGSLLVFPANKCFHATITPGTCAGSSKNPPRDLFIIHPMTS